MAYQNFIPSVWSEGINRELERLCVFAEDCNRKYEGKVKKKGESVTILGVGKPTIKRIAKASRNNDIDAPEEIEDTSVIMYINQIAYFNYLVGDIDKAQAVDGIMDALEAETSEGLANEVDTYIASFARIRPLLRFIPPLRRLWRKRPPPPAKHTSLTCLTSPFKNSSRMTSKSLRKSLLRYLRDSIRFSKRHIASRTRTTARFSKTARWVCTARSSSKCRTTSTKRIRVLRTTL